MKTKRIPKIIVLVLFMILMLSACRRGAGSSELSNFVDGSIRTFEKKTGIDLTKESNGVYLLENSVQVIAPKGDITSITLLEKAGSLTLYQIGIGMGKTEAEVKLFETFGKEKSKTLNSSNNTITYYYLQDQNEIYVHYDVDTEKVIDVSYYKKEETPKETQENVALTENAGELIAMVGDVKVYYNEAMVYLRSAQENYETEYGNDIWQCDIFGNGNNFGNLIKDEVMKQITELKIIEKKAKELDITLTEEELADANAYAKEHYEGLTTEDIDQYFVTEELLKKVYMDNMLADKVFETITLNVDTTVSDLETKQITVQDILIYNTDFDNEGKKVELTTEEKELAYEKVSTLLGQAKETDDFYTLAKDNSEADTIEYTFGRDGGPKDYSDAFEQAAFSLKAGEVSNIITTDYGWHILYCVTDFNEDATTEVKEDIIEQRQIEMFSKLYTEWSADVDVVINSEAWGAVAYTN